MHNYKLTMDPFYKRRGVISWPSRQPSCRLSIMHTVCYSQCLSLPQRPDYYILLLLLTRHLLVFPRHVLHSHVRYGFNWHPFYFRSYVISPYVLHARLTVTRSFLVDMLRGTHSSHTVNLRYLPLELPLQFISAFRYSFSPFSR